MPIAFAFMDSIPFEQLPAVYKAPTEVLEQIFLFCYHDNSVYSSVKEAPFNLAHTCTRWREIVVCIPQLWSSFNVVFSHKACRPSLPVLDIWLYRSGRFPLSFSIIYRGLNALQDEDFVHAMDLFKPFKALVNHVSRWKNVYIDFSDVPYNASFPPDLPHFDTAMVIDLRIRLFELHPRFEGWQLVPDYYLWLSTLLHASPALTHFAGYGVGSLGRLSLPWNQLTSLCLESVSVLSCLTILQDAPHLSECYFSIQGSHWHGAQAWQQVQNEICVPQLRVLSLTSNSDLSEFFERLLLPELDHLEIYMLSGARHWQQGAGISELLQRSLCPLSTLVLRDTALRGNSLESCLRHVSSSLTTLLVASNVGAKNYYIVDSLLEKLTWNLDTEEAPLCPRLENILFLRSVSAPDGILSDMIESRSSVSFMPDRSVTGMLQVSPLKHIDIELSESAHAEDMERLTLLLGKGLQGRVSMTKGIKLANRKLSIKPTPASVPILEPPPNWL